MNVIPGSAFFQVVQGSAASSGASSSSGAAVHSENASTPVSSALDRQRTEIQDIQVPQQLRQGPPGSNLDVVV